MLAGSIVITLSVTAALALLAALVWWRQYRENKVDRSPAPVKAMVTSTSRKSYIPTSDGIRTGILRVFRTNKGLRLMEVNEREQAMVSLRR